MENVKSFFQSLFRSRKRLRENPSASLAETTQDSRQPLSSTTSKGSSLSLEHPYYTTGFGFCQEVFQTFFERAFFETIFYTFPFIDFLIACRRPVKGFALLLNILIVAQDLLVVKGFFKSFWKNFLMSSPYKLTLWGAYTCAFLYRPAEDFFGMVVISPWNNYILSQT